MGIARSLMIVLEIDIVHIPGVHPKREPKITAHPYAPFAAPAAFERMQSPAGKLRHLPYSLSLLDRMKYDSQLRDKVGANAASVALFVEALKPLMPKGADLHDKLYGITVR